jgi:hypothetical protein
VTSRPGEKREGVEIVRVVLPCSVFTASFLETKLAKIDGKSAGNIWMTDKVLGLASIDGVNEVFDACGQILGVGDGDSVSIDRDTVDGMHRFSGDKSDNKHAPGKFRRSEISPYHSQADFERSPRLQPGICWL